MIDIITLCKMSQEEVKQTVSSLPNAIDGDGYVYIKGDIPILLTAHMDTVHKERVKRVTQKNGILWSPQGIGGDDRCGIYIILKILGMGYKPYVLFCEDEEKGGIGSSKFCRSKYIHDLKELKYFIGLDRRGQDDAVYYDCGNYDFKRFIETETEYKENWGSFTDICNLSDKTDVASVNLSVGYYREHTIEEYINLKDMEYTLKMVQQLLEIDYSDMAGFDYQSEWMWSDNCYDWLSDGYYITFYDNTGMENEEYYDAENEYEAIGKLMFDYPDITLQHIVEISADDWYMGGKRVC